MRKLKRYKLAVFVPLAHLEKVRLAMCKAGAGKIGQYDHCTFSTLGTGTFRPRKGAKPFLGKKGKLQKVKEARLEIVVPNSKLRKVLTAMKRAHPYEEAAYDIYKLEDF